ncbi:hypothetical protein LZZ85_25550 [Terrimonas sp. NA20]|uniref:Uncharacterized protein n=1 Tax=Terrimonas ginsenosidimutans TaxID=2908004 RepID=A0ABS9KZ82_9BACT|nr:hypothetical protein [Terrimonas ginsenosidimutans]MCG2617692.1 hypothetical protein [Terrimonas ginsenosidimutans]
MLVVFFITAFLLGLAGGIVYLIYLPFRNYLIRKGKLTAEMNRKVNIAYIFVILVLSGYFTFDAFFPGKSFFKNEFNTVTLRELPESAIFIEKNASYPDFHGDYCSSSQIMLSQIDYTNLLNEITNDTRISKDKYIVGSDEFSKTLGDKKAGDITNVFRRRIGVNNDFYYYIGFYKDGRTVFVTVCVV